jgi:hypothetical protein
MIASLRISAFLCVSAVNVRGQPVYRSDAEERKDTQRNQSYPSNAFPRKLKYNEQAEDKQQY